MIDTDVGEMLRVLRLPVERFSDTGIASARKRVASLQDLLGYRANPEMLKHYLTEVFENEFNVEFRESDLTLV